MESKKIVYKVVLTGGPCGGKTTGITRLTTFFEDIGWKVYRCQETASILLSGGVQFCTLSPEAQANFQENLLLTMLQLEETYFNLAADENQNTLVICDRGAMDPSAYTSPEEWNKMLRKNNLNTVELRDDRYDHIVHLVSTANGAQQFYTTDHLTRVEDIDLALELEKKVAQSWVGHPYYDVIDNSTDFENKMTRLIQCVCQKISIDSNLSINAKKRKFLVGFPLPEDMDKIIPYKEFDVTHTYLQSPIKNYQARLRKRGVKGHYMYTRTERKLIHDQMVEVRTHITQREYMYQLSQSSPDNNPVHKKRRCFLLNHQYYQLDIYQEPSHERCRDLMYLETYTTLSSEEITQHLPTFLHIEEEVTGDPNHSMFNLSLKENWENTDKFCVGLSRSL